MVFTHLPSNLLLAAIAFAPNLPTAIALLLAPLRALPDGRPDPAGLRDGGRRPERATAAAAYTNTARYLTGRSRRCSPAPTLRGALGAPFLIAGTLKSVYDLGLYLLFRDVQLDEPTHEVAASAH